MLDDILNRFDKKWLVWTPESGLTIREWREQKSKIIE